MNASNNVADFMEFLSKNENLEPLHQIACRAAKVEGKVSFGYTLPRGLIVLYPEFLVFLTDSQYEAGGKLMFMEYIKSVASHITYANRVNDWVNNPETIIISAAKWLMTNQNKKDFFQEALMNPNSFFIPTQTLQYLTFNKGIIALRPHNIQIKLNEGGLTIYQDPVLENQFKTLLGQFTGKWQEDFMDKINQIIRSHKNK